MESEAAEQAWLDKFGHVSSIRERTKFISGFEAGDAHARADMQKPSPCGKHSMFDWQPVELRIVTAELPLTEPIVTNQAMPMGRCIACAREADKLREYREALWQLRNRFRMAILHSGAAGDEEIADAAVSQYDTLLAGEGSKG